MTCPIVPDFILKMFEQQITRVNLSLVEKMCQLYNIDINDAKKKLSKELDINFNIVGENIEQIKIIKKHQHPKKTQAQQAVVAQPDAASSSSGASKHTNNEPDDDTPHLCEARVFIQSDLVTKRCSRLKKEGCKFCNQHQKFFDQGRLKYGTVKEEKPDEISSAKLNMMVKRKIY